MVKREGLLTSTLAVAAAAGVIAVAAMASNGATAAPKVKKGMTWLKGGSNAINGTVTVGCSGCDAYNGDTPCTTKLPVLCFLPLKAPKPTSTKVTGNYDQWSGGVVGTTPPYAGNTFATRADANKACVQEFIDPKWRVAEHHDGWGWNFQAYGNVGTQFKRFWVDINDQPNATCWAP